MSTMTETLKAAVMGTKTDIALDVKAQTAETVDEEANKREEDREPDKTASQEADCETAQEADEGSAGDVEAVRMAERERCIAIFTHASADANPKLAARLIMNGTDQEEAAAILEAVAPAPDATRTSTSLAERMAASQGNTKPGQDTCDQDRGACKKATDGQQLVSLAASHFSKSK